MWKKEYNADDFKIERVYSEAEGYWSEYQQKYDVNYSSILTKLIQEAGRWCERYASDLFIDWAKVDRFMENHEFTSEKLVFGFRQSGVDHLDFILNRMNNGASMDYYRAIWCLEIHAEDRKMTMKLGRINL